MAELADTQVQVPDEVVHIDDLLHGHDVSADSLELHVGGLAGLVIIVVLARNWPWDSRQCTQSRLPRGVIVLFVSTGLLRQYEGRLFGSFAGFRLLLQVRHGLEWGTGRETGQLERSTGSYHRKIIEFWGPRVPEMSIIDRLWGSYNAETGHYSPKMHLPRVQLCQWGRPMGCTAPGHDAPRGCGVPKPPAVVLHGKHFRGIFRHRGCK